MDEIASFFILIGVVLVMVLGFALGTGSGRNDAYRDVFTKACVAQCAPATGVVEWHGFAPDESPKNKCGCVTITAK